jgi:Ca-activated chloride channel homolog
MRAVAAVALLAWMQMPWPAAAQQATFSARRESVRVDVLVTDNGQIVRGLGPQDFEIRDNGVPQQPDLASFEQIPLNVILAFDASASLGGEKLQHLKSAGHAVLDALIAQDRVALLTFSHAVALREALTPDVARVRGALDEVEAGGSTSLVDASHAGVLVGDTDAGRSLLLVFSDGLDTTSWLPPQRVIEAARASEVVVYGVAVRGRDRPDFLRDLSAMTGGAIVEVESTKDLASTFVRILNEFRQRYLLSYSPTGVPGSGWHRLEVKVKGRRATVKSRAGYQASR